MILVQIYIRAQGKSIRPLFPKINIVRILQKFQNVTDCAQHFLFYGRWNVVFGLNGKLWLQLFFRHDVIMLLVLSFESSLNTANISYKIYMNLFVNNEG